MNDIQNGDLVEVVAGTFAGCFGRFLEVIHSPWAVLVSIELDQTCVGLFTARHIKVVRPAIAHVRKLTPSKAVAGFKVQAGDVFSWVESKVSRSICVVRSVERSPISVCLEVGKKVFTVSDTLRTTAYIFVSTDEEVKTWESRRLTGKELARVQMLDQTYKKALDALIK